MSPTPPHDASPSHGELPQVPVSAPGNGRTPDASRRNAEQLRRSRGSDTTGQPSAASLYDAVGGEPTFRALGRAFYERVANDDVLRPLYPDEDLAAAEEHLVLFLMQYWGGPRTYASRRGHPRLRMRHAPFAIGPAERDAWLRNMRAALDTLSLDDALDETLWDYLVTAAFSLQNQD